MPYTPPHRRNPEKREHDAFDKITLAVAVVGVTVIAVSAGISAWQAMIFKSQQYAMQGQLDEMQAEQRPWIRAVPSPVKIYLSDWNGNRQIGLSFSVALKNFGHLPARNITVAEWLPAHTSNAREKPLDKAEASLCAQAEIAANSDRIAGKTVFPDDSDKIGRSVTVQYAPTSYYLVGCVDYTYGASSHGKAAFRAVVGQINERGQFAKIAFPNTPGQQITGGPTFWQIKTSQIAFAIDEIGNYVQ